MASARRQIPIADLLQDGVLAINDGYRAKNSELATHGLPFARAQNINGGFNCEGADCFPETDLDRVGNKISQPGDVVFTSKGTVGRFAFVREDTPRFVYAPQLCFWRALDPNRLNARWLFYWMQSREFYVQYKGVAGQTDMAEYVSLSDQRRMHITLPPIDEQRAIAAVLGALDDKIELNRRMCRTLEGIARAIFQSWFVNFDPVRAKAAGAKRFGGMPQAVFDSLPAAFTDSPLGPIPKGWRAASLGEHLEALKGLSYKGSGLCEEGIPLHNLNSVYEGGGYKYEGIKYYEGEYRDRHIIRPGDIIVTNTEQGHDLLLIGYPAIVPRRFGDWGLFSHHLFRVRPKPESPVTRHFVYFMLMTPRVRDQITGHTNGTTVNMLSVTGLQMPLFLIPPRAVLESYEPIASPLLERAEQTHDQSPTLAAVRDTLLPKLVSGELRISDAGRIVGRAV